LTLSAVSTKAQWPLGASQREFGRYQPAAGPFAAKLKTSSAAAFQAPGILQAVSTLCADLL